MLRVLLLEVIGLTAQKYWETSNLMLQVGIMLQAILLGNEQFNATSLYY